MKILMVCLGNICRSPMAHGLLQHKVHGMGLNWQVDSAGTSNWHENELPDQRAIACMKRHGVDITYQRSRPVIAEDFQEFDILYAMDTSNYDNLMKMARNEEEMNKVKLLLSEVFPEGGEVPDPYYGGDSGFEKVFKMLDQATDKVIRRYAF